MPEPRGDIPVDGPHLVAGQIFAHFLEFHAPSLEDRMILSAEHVRDFTVRADLDLADFLENLAWDHLARPIQSQRHRDSVSPCFTKLRHRHFVKNPLDHVFARHFLGFGLVADNHAMTQHVHADGFHVLRRDVTAALEKRVGFGGDGQVDGCAW